MSFRYHVLEGELAMAAKEEGQEPKRVEQHGDHRVEIFAGSEPSDQASGPDGVLAKDR